MLCGLGTSNIDQSKHYCLWWHSVVKTSRRSFSPDLAGLLFVLDYRQAGPNLQKPIMEPDQT